VSGEPLIYKPDDDLEQLAQDGRERAGEAVLGLDPERHPWLRGVDERVLANIAVELTEFICRPSFGSRTKREVELETFALLKRHRSDWSTLGEIADDLAISRSRARSLVLDHYAREVGREGRGARRRILREHVGAWPLQQIEQQNDQLRIVIDDPFIRDLLKNFAYGRGILLDRSFASEIQTFSWDSYARLVAALHSEGTRLTEADFLILTADLRRQLRAAAARNTAAQVELDAQLQEIEKLAQKARKSKDEQRRELAVQILKQYGPTLAKIAGRAAGVPV
jgi:hypothetical protein